MRWNREQSRPAELSGRNPGKRKAAHYGGAEVIRLREGKIPWPVRTRAGSIRPPRRHSNAVRSQTGTSQARSNSRRRENSVSHPWLQFEVKSLRPAIHSPSRIEMSQTAPTKNSSPRCTCSCVPAAKLRGAAMQRPDREAFTIRQGSGHRGSPSTDTLAEAGPRLAGAALGGRRDCACAVRQPPGAPIPQMRRSHEKGASRETRPTE